MPVLEGQAALPGFPLPPRPRGLDCVITVQGNGTGRGSPRKDRTGPVHGFLTDLSGYYRAVLKHVLGCRTCESNEVLRRYLERRMTVKKFRGLVSKGLKELASQYESRDPSVERELVDEFFLRTGDWRDMAARPHLCEPQLLRGMEAVWRYWRDRDCVPKDDSAVRKLASGCGLERSPLVPAVLLAAKRVRRGRAFPEEEALAELRVGLVMLS